MLTMNPNAIMLVAAIVVTATAMAAQPRPATIDWPAVEPEALDIYQALIRFDTSATERAEAEYLKRLLDQHGIPAQVLSKDPERPNVVARLKGNGRKRPLLLLGAPRHGDGGRVEVEVPAVQRHPRRRLRLRPRRHRRQGQPGVGGDDDAAAEAAERAARPRRHPAGRVGRGGRVEPRHRLHGRASTTRRSTPSTASPKAATRFASVGRCATPRSRSPRRSCAAWS